MTVYEGVLVWTFNGEEFNTVLHYDDGGAGPPNFQGLTNDFWDEFDNAGMPGMVNDMFWTGIRWREDIPGGIGVFYAPTSGSLPGSVDTSQTAGQLAMIVQKRGVGTVRPVLGRIYQPGIASQYLEGTGLWNGTLANAVEALWEGLIAVDDHGGVSLNMVIKASNPTAPNTQAYTTVETMAVQFNPGTQRRRRRGSGS